VDELTARGVTFERYDGLAQDGKGISRGYGPDIAWFRGPGREHPGRPQGSQSKLARHAWMPPAGRSKVAGMEFQDVIRRRRMVRAYTDEPVAEESVERILAAANKAPSAGFSQGYALMTLQGPEQLGPFWELLSHYHGDEDNAGSSFDPVTRAPVVVGLLRSSCCSPWSTRASAHCSSAFPRTRSASSARSTECPVTTCRSARWPSVIQIPRPTRAAPPKVIKRRSLDELVHRGRWGRR